MRLFWEEQVNPLERRYLFTIDEPLKVFAERMCRCTLFDIKEISMVIPEGVMIPDTEMEFDSTAAFLKVFRQPRDVSLCGFTGLADGIEITITLNFSNDMVYIYCPNDYTGYEMLLHGISAASLETWAGNDGC